MRKLTDILKEQHRPDERDLRSRSDARRENRTTERRLAELAELLTRASNKTLGGLALPEPLLDCVNDARRITSSIARNRQLRRIRQELRTLDAESLRARLEARVQPGTSKALAAHVAEQWAERLLRDGEAAIDELVTAFPDADRQRLRQLVRNAVSGAPRARRSLVNALRETVTALPQ
jgi:ribosome-associated protein